MTLELNTNRSAVETLSGRCGKEAAYGQTATS